MVRILSNLNRLYLKLVYAGEMGEPLSPSTCRPLVCNMQPAPTPNLLLGVFSTVEAMFLSGQVEDIPLSLLSYA